jgi:DNA-binding NtrC family response regulator
LIVLVCAEARSCLRAAIGDQLGDDRLVDVGDARALKSVVQRTRRREPGARIVAAITHAESSVVHSLFPIGLDDFVLFPASPDELALRIGRWLPRAAEPDDEDAPGLALLGKHPRMLGLIEEARELADYDVPVLLRGETGTGKELLARALHGWGRRARASFVPVNCGAIPEALFESECFGHEAGAFTGAQAARRGLIGQAQRGTLFLDEVDSVAPLNQVKLLRFLQEKEYRPVGADLPVQVDVRVVAATSARLAELERARRFRADLRYRLEVVTLEVPALRERREDIPELARHFLARYAASYGRAAADFSPAALATLVAYEWPGNVRELENVVHRAVMRARGPVVDAAAVALDCSSAPAASPGVFREAKARLVREFEREFVLRVLREHDQNVTRAARAAGKDRRAFIALMRKHGIRRRDEDDTAP